MQNKDRDMTEEEKKEYKRLRRLEMKSKVTEEATRVAGVALEVAVTTVVGILVSKSMDKGGSSTTNNGQE